MYEKIGPNRRRRISPQKKSESKIGTEKLNQTKTYQISNQLAYSKQILNQNSSNEPNRPNRIHSPTRYAVNVGQIIGPGEHKYEHKISNLKHG